MTNLLDAPLEVPESVRLLSQRLDIAAQLTILQKDFDRLAFEGMSSYVLMYRAPALENEHKGYPSCEDTVMFRWKAWKKKGIFVNHYEHLTPLFNGIDEEHYEEGKFSHNLPDKNTVLGFFKSRLEFDPESLKGQEPVEGTEDILQKTLEKKNEIDKLLQNLKWPFYFQLFAYVKARGGYVQWAASSEKLDWGPHKRHNFIHRILLLKHEDLQSPQSIKAAVVEHPVKEGDKINDEIDELLEAVFEKEPSE